MLANASKSHDISSLIILVIKSALADMQIAIENLAILTNMPMNLKLVYQSVETAVSTGLSQHENKALSTRVVEFLSLLKKTHEAHFN